MTRSGRAAQEVSAGGRVQVVPDEARLPGERVQHREPRVRTVRHPDGSSPVQAHDRCRLDALEDGVERGDLTPVRRTRRR